jgi:hypothetical protein
MLVQTKTCSSAAGTQPLRLPLIRSPQSQITYVKWQPPGCCASLHAQHAVSFYCSRFFVHLRMCAISLTLQLTV